MSVTPDEMQRIAQAAGEHGARKVLQELGIRTDTPEAIERASDTWRWAVNQRRLQSKIGDTMRTATVWTLVGAFLMAMGYGLVHMVNNTDTAMHTAAERGVAFLRHLTKGRLA